MPEATPTTVNPGGLTSKQEAFCQNYVLNGGNGTKAVYDAGYECENENTYCVVASENLRKPKIIERIAEIRAELGVNHSITAEEVVNSFREIRDRGMMLREIYKDGVATGFYAVHDLSSAARATEGLGKILGLFIDRREVSGKDGGPIELNFVPTDAQLAAIAMQGQQSEQKDSAN